MASLLVDFWAAACGMAEGGEESVSSIVLSAPAWDDRRGGVVSVTVHPPPLFACHCYVGRRWGEWHRTVFPLLEASVLAAGLGRTLGIVCFHPRYETPSEKWLATHRFGHMYAPATLRRYCAEAGADDLAALPDDDLLYYSSYMRRSPHATINVLWSRQLAAAERRRESAGFYARNIRRLVDKGRERLEAEAAGERVT